MIRLLPVDVVLPCTREDPDWWMAGTDLAGAALNLRAIQLCNTCPVQEACLRDGLQRRANGQICGGMIIRAGTNGKPARAVELPLCEWCQRPFPPLMRSKKCCTPEHAAKASYRRSVERAAEVAA